jgi:CubicO group peptidase (beta-lactamase class C family)
MSATGLIRAEEAIYAELQRGAFPGAALAVGRRGEIVLEEGFGNTGRGWDSSPVDPDNTVFDLASLTKVVGTTTAVMVLVEDGKMGLDDRVASYLPEFTGSGKEYVTIRQLLTHTAGLPAGIDVPSGLSRAQALRYVLSAPLATYPGGRMEYSDLGAVVLYAAAERAAGEPLYHLLDRRVYGPLGMTSTSYVFGTEGCVRCAGTSRALGDAYRGRVHDPIARRMGGIAGNAGLFSTGHDLARYAAMLANGGELNGTRVLRASTIRQFAMRQPGAGSRALGWDTGGGGARISPMAFGHTGYTGTSIWIDPDRGTWTVLLTNRTYDSDSNNRMQTLRRAVNDRVAEATDRGGYASN